MNGALTVFGPRRRRTGASASSISHPGFSAEAAEIFRFESPDQTLRQILANLLCGFGSRASARHEHILSRVVLHLNKQPGTKADDIGINGAATL